MHTEAMRKALLCPRRNCFVAPVVLMLLLVLGQGAYWTGSSKWLAHALDHGKAGPALALEAHHDHGSHPDAPSDVEHKLLHEMEHVQLVPLSASAQRVLLDAAVIAVVVLVCVARRSPERTFRPPRPVF